MEVERLQGVLQDAGIDVDLKTLQNPTEEFMTNLVIKYLKKFYFDGDEISQPTPEQLGRIYCEESALNAIKAINLHAALASICEEIFLKDLTITDITSPGFKKSCKRINVLFNFFIYVRNKKMENEHLFLELDDRQKEMLDMIDGKEEGIAKIGSIIHERETKLESIKSIKTEITNLQSHMENCDKTKRKLQQHADDVTAKYQEKLQKCNALKIKAHELHKNNTDLKNKIVSSPEEYMTRTNNLKKLLEEKMEERQNLSDSINRKKLQIQNNELAQAEVSKCHKKMINIGEHMQKLKETDLLINDTKKHVDELKEEIILLEKRPSSLKGDSNKFELIEENQELLSELHNMESEILREVNMLKIKLEELRNEIKKVKALMKKEKETISVAERKYRELLDDYKNYFENEVSEELNFRNELKEFEETNK